MVKNFFLICLSMFFISCDTRNKESQIIIFCASSLAPIVEQIAARWENDHPEKIIINAASSGVLARQIEHGAQADIYISANQEWMRYLIETQHLKNHPKSITKNQLALISEVSISYKSTDIDDVPYLLINLDRKIAIGDPSHVPLGKYTKEYLDHLKIYETLLSKLILSKDARSTLRLVELGEAELGFVYLSDAITSDRVKVIAEIPEEFHTRIEYQGILLNDLPTSKTFMDFLTSSKNFSIWKSNGFSVD